MTAARSLEKLVGVCLGGVFASWRIVARALARARLATKSFAMKIQLRDRSVVFLLGRLWPRRRRIPLLQVQLTFRELNLA